MGIRSDILNFRLGCFSMFRIGPGDLGILTKRLSSVNRTATPASTLPTVREINIVLDVKIGASSYRLYIPEVKPLKLMQYALPFREW